MSWDAVLALPYGEALMREARLARAAQRQVEAQAATRPPT